MTTELTPEVLALHESALIENPNADGLTLHRDYVIAFIAAARRCAELESGQPVEVNGRMMQLVPVKNLSTDMLNAGFLALMNSKNSCVPIWDAMLTASAKEMGK